MSPPKQRSRPAVSAAAIKSAARGRCVELIRTTTGIPADLLDGRQYACPKCDGSDRFNAAVDFAETGGVFCRKCFPDREAGNGGTIIDTVMWANDWDFETARDALAEALGVTSPETPTTPSPPVRCAAAENGNATPFDRPAGTFADLFRVHGSAEAHGGATPEVLSRWCAAKAPILAETARRAGVVTGTRAKGTEACVAFPARPSPGAEPVGWLTMPASGEPFDFGNRPKDLALKGGRDGWALVCSPEEWEAAETVVRVEGIGDALALAPHLPAGWAVASNIGGAKSKRVPVGPFKGKRVVVIGDADEPGQDGAAAFAARVAKSAAFVAVAALPFEVTPTGGKDVRDLLNEADDPAAAVADLLAGAEPFAAPEEDGKPKDADGDEGRPPSHATRMVELADEAGADPFHDAEGEAFITFDGAGGVRQTHRLRTRAVRDWLASLLYVADEAAPGSEATESALNVLAARAKFDGECRPVAVRMAPHPNGVVLDLGGPEWRGVKVTADGWEALPLDAMGEAFGTRFVRPKGLHPLPEPDRGGTLADLRPFVNVADDGDFALLLGWLTAAFMTDGPFPILILNGEQGCAKSTTAKALRRIVDPNKADLRRPPKSTEDLVIAAKNGHVVALENLSNVKADLSDTLCSLSTGAGFSTRSLYTNDEEALFEFRRPVILNGIPTLADRPDLLDRAVTLVLPVIDPEDRKAERAFWPTFETARPRLLGAVLDAVSTALRNLAAVALEGSPRMADFAGWAVAAEPAFPVPPGTFLAAYADCRQSAHEAALEGEVIAGPVRELASRGEWEGSATDLLDELAEIAGDSATKKGSWPKQPNALSSRLRRIAPDLRASGVPVTFHRENSRRWIELGPSRSSPTVTPNGYENRPGDEGDDGDGLRPHSSGPPSAAEPAGELIGEGRMQWSL